MLIKPGNATRFGGGKRFHKARRQTVQICTGGPIHRGDQRCIVETAVSAPPGLHLDKRFSGARTPANDVAERAMAMLGVELEHLQHLLRGHVEGICRMITWMRSQHLLRGHVASRNRGVCPSWPAFGQSFLKCKGTCQ